MNLYRPARFAVILAALCLLGGFGAGAARSAAPALDPVAPDVRAAAASGTPVRVIVSLATSIAAPAYGEPPVDLASLRADIAVRRKRVLAAVAPGEFAPTATYEAVPAIAGAVTQAGLARLASLPDVEAISVDRATHADLAQAAPLMAVDQVRQDFGLTGAGVYVAVLDSGIQANHPMLAGDVALQRCFLSEGGCPGGGTTGPSAADDFGHGTHVSGIVTSSGPPAGIAPDAKIEAYKVLGSDGNGTFGDVLASYDDIIVNRPEVRIINMSLGDGGAYAAGSCESGIPALTAAVATARSLGKLSIASAGNSGLKTGIAYPACLNGVLGAGAVYDANLGFMGFAPCADTTTAADKITCFSQSGDALDLLAPGSAITSTYIGGGLETLSGTSMASPMTSGVAALLLQAIPSLTAAQLELRLSETGVALTDPANGLTRCRVDARRALLYLVTAACVTPGADGDADGVTDAVDNCPAVANADQANFDAAAVDNGPTVAGGDATNPQSDSLGDACDADDDNDGLPDSSESAPAACGAFDLSATSTASAPRGDATNDDDGDGDPAPPAGSDATDNGPSWDTDNDGVLDGVECALGTNPRDRASRPSVAACGGTADVDHDGLTAAAERCRWGTSDTSTDSDADGLRDCVEANDSNGDGVQNFSGDVINSARVAIAAAGKTMDFDLNGDGFVNFSGDTVPSARMALHVGGVCS